MNLIVFQLICVAITTFFNSARATCSRKPKGAIGDRSPVDDNFQIYIEGNPTAYLPGQQYNISLSCGNGLKFISFTLVVDREESLFSGYDLMGHFELIDTSETKFSSQCENMVESTNSNTKSRIDVAWVAPTNPDSGCLVIRAAVLQHRNVWFIDDGFLSKRICPEEIDEINSQTPPMSPCCACDEAKYEIKLERRWTRNTHAKYFPHESWRTRFSELIGASHSFSYRFWEYGSRASAGLQELAEHGSTRTLETEIRSNTNMGSIRTIIRAPGIPYRHNVMGTTLANVRVDPEHHIISLVTKIDPSPDWILGVAGLELCLANCTWTDRKVLNLYPWDVGTDAGPSYMSSDQPQIPPDVVRRITSTFPSDHRSPFYDESGAPMKTLATLHITRRKLYERDCEFDEAVPLECAVHPWNNWNDCSTKCGTGTQYRIRTYKDQRLAENYNCQLVLRQNQNCMGTMCGPSEEENLGPGRPMAECELAAWGSWSQCSKRCGKGFMTRRREFVNPYAKENCQSAMTVELEQTRDCFGDDCGGTIRSNYGGNNEITPQILNVDEPGLMEEDSYGGSAFQMNRRPQPGRFGESNRNQDLNMQDRNRKNTYNPLNQRQGQNILRQNMVPFINQNNLDANYQNPTNSLPYNNENDAILAHGNIYGNEKLVGQQNQAYDLNNSNLWNAKDNNLQPDEERYSDSNQFDNRNQRTMQNNRFSMQTPTTNPPTRFNSISSPNYNNQRTENLPDPLNNDGLREQYDEFGRKVITVEGGDPDNYAVVQEYCFEKPLPIQSPCKSGQQVVVGNYWFYDADDRMCKIFTTDNCDENRNKFRTLDACEGTCHRPQQILEDTQAQQFNGGGFDDGRLRFENRNFGQPESHIKENWRNAEYPSNRWGRRPS